MRRKYVLPSFFWYNGVRNERAELGKKICNHIIHPVPVIVKVLALMWDQRHLILCDLPTNVRSSTPSNA